MLELIIGIILGATFAEFWRHLYKKIRQTVSRWMDDHKSDQSTN